MDTEAAAPAAVPEGGKRSRANTRARLVEAATEVFTQKALRRVTVDDVVSAAGFTRGAFYSNFASIEELFFAVYARQADLMTAAVRSAVDTVAPEQFSLEFLRAVLETLRPFSRRWYLIQHEFALLAMRSPEARERYSREADRLRADLEHIVARVLELLRRRPLLPVQHLTDVLVALYLHSLGNEQLGTGNLDPDRLFSDVLPTLILSLSTPSGATGPAAEPPARPWGTS